MMQMTEPNINAEILDRLHDSEINGGISWIFDGGFRWFIGHPLVGIKHQGSAPTATAAIRELAEMAFSENPTSAFAAWWREARQVG